MLPRCIFGFLFLSLAAMNLQGRMFFAHLREKERKEVSSVVAVQGREKEQKRDSLSLSLSLSYVDKERERESFIAIFCGHYFQSLNEREKRSNCTLAHTWTRFFVHSHFLQESKIFALLFLFRSSKSRFFETFFNTQTWMRSMHPFRVSLSLLNPRSVLCLEKRRQGKRKNRLCLQPRILHLLSKVFCLISPPGVKKSRKH